MRAALSHQFPDRGFDQVVREVFKLVLERDRKRKALTERPRAPWERPSENDRYVPDAVKRAVWERDQGRCTWPMGMGSSATRRTASSSTMISKSLSEANPTIDNIRLLCKSPQPHEGRTTSRPRLHGEVPVSQQRGLTGCTSSPPRKRPSSSKCGRDRVVSAFVIGVLVGGRVSPRSVEARSSLAPPVKRSIVVPVSPRRRFRPMTGHKPSLQVAALDLYRSLEPHVLKISAVAGGVDGGLRDLQQLCDL